METLFFGQCYFTASRNHYWNKEKTVLRERAHSCQWKSFFFFISQRLLPVIVYFPSSESVFFNEILHSDQWKRIFWLVETVSFCSGVFPSSGNCHLNYWKPIFKERLTNATDFLTSGNHFLPFFQRAVKMEENGSRKRKKMVFTSQRIVLIS